ncbi:MAG: PD40 domain-containing protein [Prevotella sp.]|nr:PD40 domain-containing protein [Prevotella sp.]
MKQHIIALAAGIALMTSCGSVAIPDTYTEANSLPTIYPDYTNVTVPVNIAPLTFQMDPAAEEMVARLSTGDEEIICGGTQVIPDEDDWRRLAEKASGKAIKVDVYANGEGGWKHYKPFEIYVSPDSIDPYISYRLIAPSYISYEELTISQRCLENYDESVIYDNVLCNTEKQGQCINCHSYQNYNPERMQFHARQNLGGTVIAYDGTIKKINMKNDSILSAGVYPAWHPWLKLIAYATDKTHQSFHVTDRNKIEVFDTSSDLILYNPDKNEVTNLENDPDEFEVFPAWAPDGKTLYYCSAHFVKNDSTKSESNDIVSRYREIKYNIYKKSFDPETWQIGPRELVFDAAARDSSATWPRISPDGRFLVFTMGEFGYFHIWHRDADLWMMDLQTGEVRQMSELNSPNTESYHSWSSNGRWMVFSSRRDDGGFTRPFIAHIDANGRAGKPFELPSAYPDYHRQLLKSYNIPEFMRGPVTIKPQTFADVLKTNGEPPVVYVDSIRP